MSQLDAAETILAKKQARTFLACDHCRRSKLRCITGPLTEGKCQRCTRQNLDCIYTPKPSQLKKKARLDSKGSSELRDLPEYLQGTIHNYNQEFRTRCPHQLDPLILPSKALLVQILEEFFNNQYHTIFNFIHRESYIDWVKSDVFGRQFFNYDDPNDVPEFTPCTLLAILALCARHNVQLTKMYGDFNQDNKPESYKPSLTSTEIKPESASNASRYFAYYSRLLLKDVFDTPSIQRIQSLAILSAHEWTEGNSARSYLYIGIAARMGSILGLCCKNGKCYTDDKIQYTDAKHRFISLESKRRTIWSVYMMDRCNSSGRNRSHAIKIEDIEIPLPCPEENFTHGVEIEYPTYVDCFTILDKLTTLDFTIIAYELWSKIAKWVGETGSLNETRSPNDPESIFNRLYNDLNLLKEKLPNSAQLTNINDHLASSNLNFGYLHQLLFLCGIFLNREYFYYSSNISKNEHITYTKALIQDLKSSTKLITTLHSFKQFCVTPFTSFELFSNAVTLLSVSSVLHDSNLQDLGLVNLNYLKRYSNQDQLTQRWYTIASQLKNYLETSSNGFNEKLKKSSKLNNLLNDYGESEVPERLSINIPQQTKKMDLNDILNSESNERTPTPIVSSIMDSISDSSQSVQSGQSPDSSISSTSDQLNLFDDTDIDKYFKHWDKIIPNWNDVFIENSSMDQLNSYI